MLLPKESENLERVHLVLERSVAYPYVVRMTMGLTSSVGENRYTAGLCRMVCSLTVKVWVDEFAPYSKKGRRHTSIGFRCRRGLIPEYPRVPIDLSGAFRTPYSTIFRLF